MHCERTIGHMAEQAPREAAERLLEAWRGEIVAGAVYELIAQREGDPKRAEILRRMAEAELAETSELAQAGAALHGGIGRLLLALQHSHDLGNDGQDLPHDFIHVLRA